MTALASTPAPAPRRPFSLAITYPYDNISDQILARGLMGMARGLILATLIGLVLVADLRAPHMIISTFIASFNSTRLVYLTMVVTSVITLVAVSYLVNKGELRSASRVLITDLFLMLSLIYLIHLPSNAAIFVLSVPLVATGVLLSRREVVSISLATIGVIALNTVLNDAQLALGYSQFRGTYTILLAALTCMINGIMLRTFAVGRVALLEERQRLINELQALNQSLEHRVADRTRDLVLASQISKATVSIIDLETLLPRAVQMTRDAFDLYHVALYTFDEATQTLVLNASNGDASHKTSFASFPLKSPQGAIAKAAREREAVLINDASTSSIFLADPSLPGSKSEVALPMMFSGELIGVLDLQSRYAERFAPEDLRMFQTLTDKISVAIHNSELFAEISVAREEAERSNQVKSAFLASMSHELRTPLNAIINFTKFVARGVMGPVNEKQVSTLTSVIDGGEHLLALINDVLDISKIESGSLNLFLQDVNMSEVLASAEKTAQSLLADKPVELVQDIAPDLPRLVGDQQRILQVVLNMVSNACKFTREGEIRIAASATADEMMISVSDTGPGIDPEDYDAVFEKFKQTETGLRQGGGTGLGMPISRSLIEAHGGRMWIEGAKGKGATFKFVLPLQAKIDPRMVTVES